MRWLILHLAELREGCYPQPDKDTGYIDPAIRGIHYREPAQNRVLELAAEVESRLELVLNLMSGWERLDRKFYKYAGKISFKMLYLKRERA